MDENVTEEQKKNTESWAGKMEGKLEAEAQRRHRGLHSLFSWLWRV